MCGFIEPFPCVANGAMADLTRIGRCRLHDLEGTAVSLPPDIANLLAVAIRDVIWFKDGVCSFLKACGVPTSVRNEVRQIKHEPTIKIVRFVLDELGERGEDGDIAAKTMLTKMYYWNDMHSVAEERRDKAIASLKALRESYTRYEAQIKY